MDYKERFFARYVSTHTGHRDGAATLVQFRQRATYFQQRWSAFFPQQHNVRIVDLGCGNGALLWWLQSSGYRHAEGVDVSAEQVAEAQRLGVRNVTQGDLQLYLNQRPDTYDVIVMRDVLEHFTKAEMLSNIPIVKGSSLRTLSPVGG
jgi:2-polyprenyl-3-methyl-5-hydroxy-6-metoxy-1,4-benzoquinol methylase